MVDSGKEKRKQLVQVAQRDDIQEHGMRKTTLEDIARAAGMATISLYYYFNKKMNCCAQWSARCSIAHLNSCVVRLSPSTLLQGLFLFLAAVMRTVEDGGAE